MPPVLYLIDGHALAYRTYFALTRGSNSFATRSGEPTAGVFGFTSVLLKILEQEHPDYLAVAFDTGRTFRDDLYREYKGTREKMPDDLQVQIERIRQLVDAFNIPRLEVEGYEADDVLGSIARQASLKGLGVKIITGDRDLLQLVNDRVVVNLPGKSLSEAKDYRPDDVVAYLGVRPEQVVDYKALVGDTSDNIPGVAGIGEKTAVTLLQKYSTLEGIYEHLAELGEGVRKKLEAGHDMALLSHKLAEIVTDLSIPFDLEKARTGSFDPPRVEDIFRELEFRTLITRLTALYPKYGKKAAVAGQQLTLFETDSPAPSVQVSSPKQVEYRIIDTPAALEELTNRLSAATRISFDTETTSTDQMRASLVGVSLAVEDNLGYYIPVGHVSDRPGQQLPLQVVLDALRGPMTDPNIPKVGHNLKYDFVLLARHGLRPTPLAFDTMIAEWLTNPNSRNLGLKNLAWVRLNYRMTEIEELIGKGKNQKEMKDVPIAEAAPYAAADAAIVLRLIEQLQPELEAVNALPLMHELEMPLVKVLADMEMAGVSLDKAFLEKMSGELAEKMGQCERLVYEAVGESFNLNSTQQLSHALFDRLKLSPPGGTKRTASGFYSTSADVLDALRGKHPMVDTILEYRELSKLKSTYVDALPLVVNPETNRVHTQYNQTGAVTGRIASSGPNLQNIPIRTEVGRQVRNAFVADPGNYLLSVDYSQVELRIVAHMSDDQAMLDAFLAGQDIHAATAAAIYNVPIEQVTKDQRRNAKSINFGLTYGMSAYGLMNYTGLTLAESEDFVEVYNQRFPGVKRFLDGIRRTAARQGFVETLMGRRRYFPELQSETNVNVRNRAEREAINAPVQGTAADIMKIAMLRVPQVLKEAGLSAQILLQVHDELVVECPQSELKEAARLVQKVMEEAYSLKAPLRTEARYGTNWGTMIPVSPSY